MTHIAQTSNATTLGSVRSTILTGLMGATIVGLMAFASGCASTGTTSATPQYGTAASSVGGTASVYTTMTAVTAPIARIESMGTPA